MALTGKVVLVTGAAQGIGRGIALRLAKEGADIALVDLKEEGLAKVKRSGSPGPQSGGIHRRYQSARSGFCGC